VRFMWHQLDGTAEHDELRRAELLGDGCCDWCFCFNPRVYSDRIFPRVVPIALPPVVLVGGKIIDANRESLVLPPRKLGIEIQNWTKILTKGVELVKALHCSYSYAAEEAGRAIITTALHEQPASSFVQDGQLSDGKIISSSVRFKSDIKAVWEHVGKRLEEQGAALQPIEDDPKEDAKAREPKIVQVSTAVATKLAKIWLPDCYSGDIKMNAAYTALEVLMAGTVPGWEPAISVALTKLDAPDSELGDKLTAAQLITNNRDRPFRVQSSQHGKDVRTSTWNKLIAP